jgi:hypothetical protein
MGRHGLLSSESFTRTRSCGWRPSKLLTSGPASGTYPTAADASTGAADPDLSGHSEAPLAARTMNGGSVATE